MDPKPHVPTLQDRVRASIAPNGQAVTDRFTGKLTCHRFMIPAHFLLPDPLDPKSAKLNLNMGHVACLGERCSIWNAEDKECFDVTNAKSAKRTAAILDLIDGHARMSEGK